LRQGHALAQAPGPQAVITGLEALSLRHLCHQSSQLMQPANRLKGRARLLLHPVRMDRTPILRPVLSSTMASPNHWPEGSREAAEALHRQLMIGDRDWHALKGQPQRRGAEQLAAALVQLLDEGNGPAIRGSTQQRQQAIALVEHALAWLQGSLKDPGCPSHGR
jgi:hypothetical protein